MIYFIDIFQNASFYSYSWFLKLNQIWLNTKDVHSQETKLCLDASPSNVYRQCQMTKNEV